MNQTMRAAPDQRMGRYVGWFTGIYLGICLVVGAIMVLIGFKGSTSALGFVAMLAACYFARSRFFTDHGRNFRRDERWRLFKGTVAVCAAISLVSAAFIIGALQHGGLFGPRWGSGFALFLTLLIATLATGIYALIAWLGYWVGMPLAPDADMDEPAPGFRTPARATASAPSALARPGGQRVLVIGSGGREHALAWKLAQSSRVSEVLVAPGNAGTARERKCRNAQVDVRDIDALLQLARREAVDLTVVGPEGPLVAGIVDRFRTHGMRIFGPKAKAAQLEGSKAFAKDFLKRHGIPTAGYEVFTEVDAAIKYIHARTAELNDTRIVVKADGLAAGKGVIVAMSVAEAEGAVRDMLAGNAFGTAGSRVVIEDFLDGEEASFISMVDGMNALPMATSQDHKRIFDGDTGPNTGGMGAYSPAPVVTPGVHARVMREIVEPTVRGMTADGVPFTGFLYAGLMIDAQGAPKVIEFNVRFGDPETQPVMMRLQSDLLELLEDAIDGRLAGVEPRWNTRPSLGVVMAAAGYPDSPRLGDPIVGLEQPVSIGTKVFHSGTSTDDAGRVVTAGGRVLCVCALGDSVAEAKRDAYEAVARITWDGEQHRTDIGWRAVAREQH